MPPETEIDRAIRGFLRDKGKGEAGESGNYRSDAERELRRFLNWLWADLNPRLDIGTVADADEDALDLDAHTAPTFSALDERTFRRYARHLVSQGYSKGTTRTYYAYVASFCGWSVDEGHLPRHYANTGVARAPLPDDDGRKPGDQQAWTAEQRDVLTRHVDARADRALDARSEEGDEIGAVRACRDRAIAYVLAYTGVRATEVFADREDERRNGIRWGEVNLDDGGITILRKKQGWDDAPLPEPVIHPLSIHRRVLDPPNDEWPVFPTLHRPTLSEAVHDTLGEDGVARAREKHGSDLFVCRARGITPPALSSNAARRVMKQLCDAAPIDVDDDRHEYLAPHGGRRGMGEVLVRQYGYAAAARYLDNSEEMVRQRYSHIEAGRQADRATRALVESDSRVRSPDESADESATRD